MQKKLIVGIIVALVVVAGGIFLWQQQQTKPYSATPTKWSQAGDYRITETSEGTIIENQKAGFSFKVPEGWTMDEEYYGLEEYTLNLLSSDAQLNEQKSLKKGCGVSLNTLQQRDEIVSVKAHIASLLQEEGKQISSGNVTETVVEISGHPAYKTINTTTDPRFLEKFGRITQVRIPADDVNLILVGSSIMPIAQPDCDSKFEKLLASFLIK